MKRLMALLLGTMLSAPALAQGPSAPPAAAANGGVRYAPVTQRLGDGQYRAEVRRSGAAADADEVARSQARKRPPRQRAKASPRPRQWRVMAPKQRPGRCHR